MANNESNDTGYADLWDNYVEEQFPRIQGNTPFRDQKLADWRVLNTTDEHYDWPGDEWGDRHTVEGLLNANLLEAFNSPPEHLCELGAGAGRYTELVFERFPDTHIYSFDVSASFEKALRERCQAQIAATQLETFLLQKGPGFLFKTLRQRGLERKLDGVYSFDAMVHVDLHTLFIYWASAALLLKPGGILAMSVADACNPRGLQKLIVNAPGVYQLRGAAGGHFLWISREIVETVLQSLGFGVEYPLDNGRDLFFRATLVEPDLCRRQLERAGSGWHR